MKPGSLNPLNRGRFFLPALLLSQRGLPRVFLLLLVRDTGSLGQGIERRRPVRILGSPVSL